jgi:hypothetical protein
MIIVEYIPDKRRFIFLGAGYGYAMSARPSAVFGNLDPVKEEDDRPKVCVCDNRGVLDWFYSDEMRVVSVDGVDVDSWPGVDSLEAPKEPMRCVLCGKVVTTRVCPDCDGE